MKMSGEHWWDDTDRERRKYAENKLSASQIDLSCI
jgi:hypothetical protein